MTDTTHDHPLIRKLNLKIARLTNEAATKELTPRQAMTPKRKREYEQRLGDAQAIRVKVGLLEGFRDALATGALPIDLLGISLLGEETFDWLVAHNGWPEGQWNRGIVAALTKAGITESTYKDKRARFLALSAPPDQDAGTSIEIKRRMASFLPGSIPGFFPTPRPVIDRMLQYAGIIEGDTILEPSAGRGDILDRVKEIWDDAVEVFACECNHDLRELLEMKGYPIVPRIGLDFMNGGPFDQDPRFDRIIGNPPFEKGQDRQHIMRAYEWLAPGGTLTMICSEGPFFRTTTADVQFRLWLASMGGETDQLPDDAFKSSGTSTKCRIVTIAK